MKLSQRSSLDYNNKKDKVIKYSNSGLNNTYYLGYRDIPSLLEKHVRGNRAIDYGCGTGRSSRFLQQFGFTVLGVDPCQKMLAEAITEDNQEHYVHIDNAKIPVLEASYDLFFSCFVLLVVPTKKDILAIFNEAYRCLKPGGTFVIVTASEHLYSHEWASYKTSLKPKDSLNSGDEVEIQLRDLEINFINYYWTDADYASLFQEAGFHLVEKHFPMGTPNDGQSWISEEKQPPYVVYVLQK